MKKVIQSHFLIVVVERKCYFLPSGLKVQLFNEKGTLSSRFGLRATHRALQKET